MYSFCAKQIEVVKIKNTKKDSVLYSIDSCWAKKSKKERLYIKLIVVLNVGLSKDYLQARIK